MTAIALLNANVDPHLVADTLLSAEGEDSRTYKRVWLPAKGNVPTEWEGVDGKWHISRLGRKTFTLPNGAGILAFSGDCSAAFRFWARLSDSWHLASSYDETMLVDRSMLDRVLHEMPDDARRFTLLGILIDRSGHREPFTHNEFRRLETSQFGICYVAGSGAQTVVDIVRKLDQALVQAGGWPHGYLISATEDLAEHISAEMLWWEGDIRNGIEPSTPLALYCGGYYEWYQIERRGIRPMRPRLDLHLSISDCGLTITRAHFVEQVEVPQRSHTVSQRISTSVLNLGVEPVKLSLAEGSRDGVSVDFDETWGTLISSTFEPYDIGSGSDRLWGRLTPELLRKSFDPPVVVHRVRIILARTGQDGVMKRFISNSSKGYAELSTMNGQLSLRLVEALLAKTRLAVHQLSSTSVV